MNLQIIILLVSFFILGNINSQVFSVQTITVGSLDIRLTDILLLVLWFPCILKLRQLSLSFKYSRISKLILVFLLWSLLSAFVVAPCYDTPILNGSLPHLRSFVYWTLFFLSFTYFTKEQQVVSFFYSFLFILALISTRILFETIYLYKTSTLMLVNSQLRVNECFHQILFFFCLSLTRFITKKSTKRLLYIAMAISICSLLITNSRGTLLTTVFGIFIYLFISGSLRQKMLKQLSFLLCLLVLVTYLVGGSSFANRFIDRYRKGIDDIKFIGLILNSKGSFRDYLSTMDYPGDQSLIRKGVEYEAIYDEVKKSPLWGLGLGHEYEKLWMRGRERYKVSSYVHSVYNYFLMDTGVIGLLLFIALIYLIAKTFLTLFKQTEIPLHKGMALGCFLSTISLALNSFNGSFLLSIPYIAFFAVFSGMSELLIIQMKEKALVTYYSHAIRSYNTVKRLRVR